MRVAGTRADGALWIMLDGGMSVLLHATRCSPPTDHAEVERLGPWTQVPRGTAQTRTSVLRALEQARTVPLRTFLLGGPGSGNFGHAGRPGEVGGSASEGGSSEKKSSSAASAKALPHRPLTSEEKANLATYVEKATAKLAGPNPTGQTAKDLQTVQQPQSAYPPANTGNVEHSFEQFTKPGTSFDEAVKAMETGKPGVLTPERQQLHDALVRLHLQTAGTTDNPSVVVMGGGPASGKSSMPQADMDAVVVDPDQLRVYLPDYATKAGGPDVTHAAVFTHEEASALAKRIASEAGANRNLLIDGTGDKSAESMMKKIEGYRKNGQRVVGRYATNSVETALKRAEGRAQKPPYRAVPETVSRVTHAGVSRVLPKLMAKDAFDHVELWDTEDTGKPATLVMSKSRGKDAVIHNEERWQSFLAKGTVEIGGSGH